MRIDIGRIFAATNLVCLLCGFWTAAVFAAPVTGWQTDQLVGNPNPGLTDANTNSPIWGTGDVGSTNSSAIWASIPTMVLDGDRTLSLSASVELVGSDATHEQFRFGLLDSNGSGNTAGWLGFLAQNGTGNLAGALSAKNPLGEAFATSPFGSVLGSPPRGIALDTAVDPEQDFFFTGTYNLQMSIRRTGDSLTLNASIIGGNFVQIWSNVIEADLTRLTYEYDRVGFFAGAALAAEQIRVMNVDAALVAAGDTNGDLLVDMTDYANITANFNQTVSSRLQGDVTGDSRVDLRDYREWRDHRTDVPGAGATSDSPVPEPGFGIGMALATIGPLSVFFRRKR